jgi:serine/threonine-protein kinase
MSDETRVGQLVDEILESDRTPEEICADCPELLAEVRERYREVRLLEAELDAVFPSPTLDRNADALVASDPAAELPDIPGYQVDAVIGRGGMGIVYKARHSRLNRTVALKMLLAGTYADRVDRQRFLREAEAVAALRHANIVQIYDMGEHDGRPYFTMELAEGGSLHAKVAGTPQLAAWAASLMAPLAGAVHFAHQSGIVHRDLKPANDLLTADGTPKVTDFGLAWRLDDKGGLTLSGVLLGTPSYMAPEQARGEKSAIGPATDVYALGAILYELLTGRPPFRADTATATLRQVVDEEPASPTRLNSRGPRDLETICLKCLQKGPAERYASAAALSDDLRRFVRGEPIAARPPGALERAAKWARRRPATAALLAAGLLMLAGVTSAAVWYAGDRARLRAEARSRGREANDSLDVAETNLKSLRAQLDDPIRVHELLSDIDHWQAMTQQARQSWRQAVSASVGEEVRVAEETLARIRAVEVAVQGEEAAYQLAKDLDDIAVAAFASTDVSQSQRRKAIAEYERHFSKHGLDLREPKTARFASAIRSSPVRFALIAALDNWALLAGIIKWNERRESLSRGSALEHGKPAAVIEDPLLARLLELTRAADPDPWRDRFRDPAVRADRAALTRLADEADVGRQSPTILAALGWSLFANGADPTALFERALLDHPRDFWLNRHALMRRKDPGAAIGLALSALAVRPQSTVVYCTLAWNLQERGNWRAALAAANRAIEINPIDPNGYVLRGLAQREQKDLPAAIADFQRALEFSPESAWPRYNLGRVSQQQGRYAEAEEAYLGAIQVQPSSYGSYLFLAQLLATCPDDKVRDSMRAVEYATTACKLSDWKDPNRVRHRICAFEPSQVDPGDSLAGPPGWRNAKRNR